MGLFRRRRRDDVDVASCLANLGRLDALKASGLLERGRDDTLDGLTREAATRLGAPMAFINVLDEQWQYRLSSHGWEGPRQEPAEESYCQYVVAQDDVLIVTDSTTDPLVANNPATVDGNVRAYLGVPVRRDGHCLGSLCVVDDRAREWTDEDFATLRQLAGRVTAQA